MSYWFSFSTLSKIISAISHAFIHINQLKLFHLIIFPITQLRTISFLSSTMTFENHKEIFSVFYWFVNEIVVRKGNGDGEWIFDGFSHRKAEMCNEYNIRGVLNNSIKLYEGITHRKIAHYILIFPFSFCLPPPSHRLLNHANC